MRGRRNRKAYKVKKRGEPKAKTQDVGDKFVFLIRYLYFLRFLLHLLVL